MSTEEPSTLSLRERILASKDIDSELVDIPQWGVEVEVRSMNGHERAKFLETFTDDSGKVNYEAMYPSLLIATVFDPETGDRVFSDADSESINTKSGAALERIARVSLRISGMGKDAETELGKD